MNATNELIRIIDDEAIDTSKACIKLNDELFKPEIAVKQIVSGLKN